VERRRYGHPHPEASQGRARTTEVTDYHRKVLALIKARLPAKRGRNLSALTLANRSERVTGNPETDVANRSDD